jgi:chromosome partitioning protein
LETIADVNMFANADLKVRGVIATMYDGRTVHGRSVLDDMQKRYGLDLIGPPVRKSIRFAEAPGMSRCILQHAPGSQGAEAYRAIAKIIDADTAGVPGVPPGDANDKAHDAVHDAGKSEPVASPSITDPGLTDEAYLSSQVAPVPAHADTEV